VTEFPTARSTYNTSQNSAMSQTITQLGMCLSESLENCTWVMESCRVTAVTNK